MSEPTDAELAREIRETVLTLLWRQWQAIGAMTGTADQPAQAVVDPESLILMSLALAEEERRLPDVVAAWVRVNSGLLSLQRLKNLAGQFPEVVRERLGAIAEIGATEAKDLRWATLRSKRHVDMAVRGGKARAVVPRFRSIATLMLQLRQGMGVGAKADTLAFLLGVSAMSSEQVSVATLAEETGYTPATVRKAADDLAAARFLRVPSTVSGSREPVRQYRVEAGAWWQVLGVAPHQPGWGYWRERYLFVLETVTLLERLNRGSVTAYARDVEARELLARHRGALGRDGTYDAIALEGREMDWGFLVEAGRRVGQGMQLRG